MLLLLFYRRMDMKKSVSFIVGLIMLMLAASAGAGERAGAFSISPFAGGYTFDGRQHLETVPLLGLRVGYDLTKNLGVEAMADYVESRGTRSGIAQKVVSYRIDLLYNFMADGPLVPYLAVGGGGLTYGGHGVEIKGENTDATVNAGVGLKYFLTDSIALRGDARQLFLFEDPNSPKYNWEYSMGVTFLFGGNKPPVAATTEAAATKPAASSAAPAPVPAAKMAVTPTSITAGQMATLIWISQEATNCDIQPNIGSVEPQGSMEVTSSATTRYVLTCNGPGGSAKSTSELVVTGATSKAATSAPAVGTNEPAMTLTVHFASGKAEVLVAYQEGLAKIGNFMMDNPAVTGVIEGHADSIGAESYNYKLSERRALAVKHYLTSRFGIDPSRLSVKGYDSTKPISDNYTSDGRRENRRAVIMLKK
jgi:OmpA-OmpF porin, OOP family